MCQVTVGVLGDVSRAVEAGLARYCDDIMGTLLSNLQSADVHRMIKPPILSVFGDIALAIGQQFENYLQHVVAMLQSAMQLSVQQQAGGEDAAEYNNLLRHGERGAERWERARRPAGVRAWVCQLPEGSAAARRRQVCEAQAHPGPRRAAPRARTDPARRSLRAGILEAWAGMLNGLTKEQVEQYLKPYAPTLLEFVEAIYSDKEGRDDGARLPRLFIGIMVWDTSARLPPTTLACPFCPCCPTAFCSRSVRFLAEWMAVAWPLARVSHLGSCLTQRRLRFLLQGC